VCYVYGRPRPPQMVDMVVSAVPPNRSQCLESNFRDANGQVGCHLPPPLSHRGVFPPQIRLVIHRSTRQECACWPVQAEQLIVDDIILFMV
jgi:hypothetical protein